MATGGKWLRYISVDINNDGTLQVERVDKPREHPVEEIVIRSSAALPRASSSSNKTSAASASAAEGGVSISATELSRKLLAAQPKVKGEGDAKEDSEVVFIIGKTSKTISRAERDHRVKSAVLWAHHLELLTLPEQDAILALGHTVVNGTKNYSLEMSSSKAGIELSRMIREIERLIEALRNAKPASKARSKQSSSSKAAASQEASEAEFVSGRVRTSSSSKDHRLSPRKSLAATLRKSQSSATHRRKAVVSSATESEASEAEPVPKRAKTGPSSSSSRRVPSSESTRSQAKRRDVVKDSTHSKKAKPVLSQHSSHTESETESETQSETESVTEDSDAGTTIVATPKATSSSSKVQTKAIASRGSVPGSTSSKKVAEASQAKKSKQQAAR